jgi:hypothetical protein
MKCCAIIYHKNALSLYNPKWIKECLMSIDKQTFKSFDILELNYGNDTCSIMDTFNINKKRYFWKIPMDNHAHAMNFLLTAAFEKYNYDFVFNINIDDYYDLDRFKTQLSYHDKYKFEVCSSNHKVHHGNINYLEFIDYVKVPSGNDFIKSYLDIDKNIICHPSVCFYKSFWKKTPEICYKDEIPLEDYYLWNRCIANDINLLIIPEFLVIYRKHPNQITSRLK